MDHTWTVTKSPELMMKNKDICEPSVDGSLTWKRVRDLQKVFVKEVCPTQGPQMHLSLWTAVQGRRAAEGGWGKQEDRRNRRNI